MPVDPALQTILDGIAAAGAPPMEDQSPDEARAMLRMLSAFDGEPVQGVDVVERAVPGPSGPFVVRTYRPTGAGDGDLPVVVWFHGGGWVIGDLDTSDAVCRKVAVGSGALVASVDYRLAPEHPFPAGLDDCWAATRWIADHAGEWGGDASRLAVGGDSAGANLAAVVAILASDAGGPSLRQQVLVYPVTDGTCSQPSHVENGEGYLLSSAAMRWFVAHYLSGGEGSERDPRISPLFADDLAGVAAAVVLTAEFDPLRDEGEAFAERLAAAGVDVASRRFDGMVHGFYGLGALTAVADEAVAWSTARLRTALA